MKYSFTCALVLCLGATALACSDDDSSDDSVEPGPDAGDDAADDDAADDDAADDDAADDDAADDDAADDDAADDDAADDDTLDDDALDDDALDDDALDDDALDDDALDDDALDDDALDDDALDDDALDDEIDDTTDDDVDDDDDVLVDDAVADDGMPDGGTDDGGTDDAPEGGTDDDASTSTFSITSPNFEDGADLPDDYTCEGKEFGGGHSPELNWSGAPEGTQTYALVFKDLSLEADAPQFAFHWAAWNIPVSVTGIPEGLSVGDFPVELDGGEQFRAGPPHDNEFFGPCPSWATLCEGAPRTTDSYSFTLYAFEEAELSPPEPVEGENYVAALSNYFESLADSWTELQATSDAAPTSAPMCPVEPDAGTDGGVVDTDAGAPEAGADAGDGG